MSSSLGLGAHPDALSATAMEGSSDGEKAILNAEAWLGFYVHDLPHIEAIPHPADYVVVFKPINKIAKGLFRDLRDLGEFCQDEIRAHGGDVRRMALASEEIADVTDKVIQECSAQSSKGAPRNDAVLHVIQKLRLVFRHYYRGQVELYSTRIR